MKTFSLLIHDRRYSVPNLQLITVVDEDRAREFARVRLDESDHHQAVEVHDNDEPVFRLERGDPDSHAG